MQILVNHKDGENLLQKKYLEEISDAHKVGKWPENM